MAALLCAALFALVTWQVVVRGPLLRLDERLGRALVGHGPRPLTEALADLGSLVVALPVLAAALAYAFWRERRAEPGEDGEHGGRDGRRRALRIVLAMAAVPLLVVPLKALVDRPGPLTDAVASTGYYPSGHTATAMVAYGGAALALSPRLGLRRMAPAAGALTLATGVGLVLRGHHWPLDVVGSWLLCGVLLLWAGARGGGLSSRCRRRSSSRTAAG